MKLFLKIAIALLVLLFVFFGVLGSFYFYYNTEVNKPIVVTDSNQSFEIQKGSSISDIAVQLEILGFLSRPEILKFYLLQHPNKIIQAGYYKLDKTKTYTIKDLVDLFQTGSFNVKLTFLEGWRVEEYADYLSKKISPQFAEKFLQSKYIKEGYMFPDTYTIDINYDPSKLVSFMRNTFNNKVSNKLFSKANETGLTKEQVVILASILEREMNIEKDKPIVAGILIKRLNNGWPLQTDATVQYIKGTSKNWWPIVTPKDLKTLKSPYNTYLNKGLPPKPISNPGFHSIEAVINYKESPYWFYVTGKGGVTYYAKTLEGHNQNVNKYLR